MGGFPTEAAGKPEKRGPLLLAVQPSDISFPASRLAPSSPSLCCPAPPILASRSGLQDPHSALRNHTSRGRNGRCVGGAGSSWRGQRVHLAPGPALGGRRVCAGAGLLQSVAGQASSAEQAGEQAVREPGREPLGGFGLQEPGVWLDVASSRGKAVSSATSVKRGDAVCQEVTCCWHFCQGHSDGG